MTMKKRKILLTVLILLVLSSLAFAFVKDIVMTPDYNFVLGVRCVDGGVIDVQRDDNFPNGDRVELRCLPFRPE